MLKVQRRLEKIIGLIMVLWLAAGCSTAGLSRQEVATLKSLQQVDDYPLYTMTYHGAMDEVVSATDARNAGLAGPATAQRGSPDPRCHSAADLAIRSKHKSAPDPRSRPARSRTASPPAWACSLFAALGDPENRLYGRNFDWQFSPALLLFTDPPDGYASVSMVDIAYFGFEGEQAEGLATRPLRERQALLDAPRLPFDGMNEHGLVVGMAAVPPGHMRGDLDKPAIGSVRLMREMLDHARNVDEALALVDRYNVDHGGGPPIHYLVADRSGRAALIEFYRGEQHILPNEAPWHLATNFLRASVSDPAGQCRRYDTLDRRLVESEGRLSHQEAMDLLAQVAQGGTQWSAVYDLTAGTVSVAMGRDYQDVHTFEFDLASE